jgi:putative SOS response-associated peptidase YedK
MPAILRKEDYGFWLDQSVNPKDYFSQNILMAYPEDDMEAWQITKGLDYRQDDKKLIQPVEQSINLDEAKNEQRGLFES